MLPTERIDYVPIAGRKKLHLPDGKRLIVWVIVNVEEWNARETMPRTVLTPPAGGSPTPDIPNWAWHEYGNRVGFWRMLAVFDDLKIPAVLAINGSAIKRLRANRARCTRSQMGVHRPRLYAEEYAKGRRRKRGYP